MIGVTGWTPDVLADMTTPGLKFILKKRGRILYPKLKPFLESNLANLSNDPKKDEFGNTKPGSIDEIIRRYENSKQGIRNIPTIEEEKRAYAVRILLSEYLGDPDLATESTTIPVIPGLSVESARGIVDWVKSGDIDDEMWLAIEDIWRNINSTATQEVSHVG